MDKEIPVYRNIFLTGKPGAGKSTAIKRIIEEIEKKGINEVSGFLTEEIRGENGVREGFMLKTVDGKREGLLSHIRDIKSKYKVGKYNVSIPNIENIAVPTMALDEGIPLKILIIDEIGKMECFSQVFLDSSYIFILFTTSSHNHLRNMIKKEILFLLFP